MEQEQNPIKPELRGLYRHVNISVKSLDRIILVCIAVILLVVFLELRDPGFTIVFDSKGGTDVMPCTCMYGDLLTAPEPPTREGYQFTGWYKDDACYDPWDMAADTVEMDMTLYAGWEKTE